MLSAGAGANSDEAPLYFRNFATDTINKFDGHLPAVSLVQEAILADQTTFGKSVSEAPNIVSASPYPLQAEQIVPPSVAVEETLMEAAKKAHEAVPAIPEIRDDNSHHGRFILAAGLLCLSTLAVVIVSHLFLKRGLFRGGFLIGLARLSVLLGLVCYTVIYAEEVFQSDDLSCIAVSVMVAAAIFAALSFLWDSFSACFEYVVCCECCRRRETRPARHERSEDGSPGRVNQPYQEQP